MCTRPLYFYFHDGKVMMNICSSFTYWIFALYTLKTQPTSKWKHQRNKETLTGEKKMIKHDILKFVFMYEIYRETPHRWCYYSPLSEIHCGSSKLINALVEHEYIWEKENLSSLLCLGVSWKLNLTVENWYVMSDSIFSLPFLILHICYCHCCL
jgi:hypothetical protein